MAWEPLTKPLGAVVSERLASPLVGSFVISWLIINWKVVVILLSKAQVSTSFKMIEGIYAPLPYAVWLLLVAPLLSALLYLYALPYASRPVTKWWLQRRKDAEDDRIKIERLAVLDVPKSLEILDENHTLRNEKAQMKAERNEAIEKARVAVSAANEAEFRRDAAEKTLADVEKAKKELWDTANDLTEKAARFEKDLSASVAERLSLLQLLDVTSDEWAKTSSVLFEYDPLLAYIHIALSKDADFAGIDLTFQQMLVLRAFNMDGSMGMPRISALSGVPVEQVKTALDMLATARLVETRNVFAGKTSASLQFQVTPLGAAIAQRTREYERRVRP